jgi:hypothetical protein
MCATCPSGDTISMATPKLDGTQLKPDLATWATVMVARRYEKEASRTRKSTASSWTPSQQSQVRSASTRRSRRLRHVTFATSRRDWSCERVVLQWKLMIEAHPLPHQRHPAQRATGQVRRYGLTHRDHPRQGQLRAAPRGRTGTGRNNIRLQARMSKACFSNI